MMGEPAVKPIWVTLEKAGFRGQAQRIRRRLENRRLEKKAEKLAEEMKRGWV